MVAHILTKFVELDEPVLFWALFTYFRRKIVQGFSGNGFYVLLPADFPAENPLFDSVDNVYGLGFGTCLDDDRVSFSLTSFSDTARFVQNADGTRDSLYKFGCRFPEAR